MACVIIRTCKWQLFHLLAYTTALNYERSHDASGTRLVFFFSYISLNYHCD